MHSLCSCIPFRFSGSSEELDESSLNENISENEKRRRAAEAAEKRLKQQQMRGVQAGSKPMRISHKELQENINSNLKWQVS